MKVNPYLIDGEPAPTLLLYHVMTSIALSADTMEAFGKLNDGISLYSAQLISSRMYHLFAVYTWLQLLTGTAFTGMLLYFIRPALSDTEGNSAPDVVDGATKVASGATKAAAGLL